MKLVLLMLGLIISSAGLADGKALHDAACLQCHASLGGGDPHKLYQRSERKVKTLGGLEKRVAYCMTAADVSWSKAEQKMVVEYLREQFYHF